MVVLRNRWVFKLLCYPCIEVVYMVVGEIRKQIVTLMTAALGFVAALTWNDAIKAWLAPLYEDASGRVGLTIAAVIVTIVVVALTMIIAKVAGEKK